MFARNRLLLRGSRAVIAWKTFNTAVNIHLLWKFPSVTDPPSFDSKIKSTFSGREGLGSLLETTKSALNSEQLSGQLPPAFLFTPHDLSGEDFPGRTQGGPQMASNLQLRCPGVRGSWPHVTLRPQLLGLWSRLTALIDSPREVALRSVAVQQWWPPSGTL